MRAILIDPSTQTITEVDYNGDYKQIYTFIDAASFDCVQLNESDTIYVDDEGLLNDAVSRISMFRVDGDNPAYLAGKGLVLGTNEEGESIGTELSLVALSNIVAFGRPERLNGHMYFVSDHAYWEIK